MFQIVEYVIAGNQSLAEKSKAFSSDDDSKWTFCSSVLYWWSLCVRMFPLSASADVLCFLQFQDPGQKLVFCLFS